MDNGENTGGVYSETPELAAKREAQEAALREQLAAGQRQTVDLDIPATAEERVAAQHAKQAAYEQQMQGAGIACGPVNTAGLNYAGALQYVDQFRVREAALGSAIHYSQGRDVPAEAVIKAARQFVGFLNGEDPKTTAELPRQPRRVLDGHKVNPANDKLEILVLDGPGAGGACHLYQIEGFDSGSNPSDPWTERYGKASDHTTILFQNGPIAENGVNGITQEVLLAIVIDRLESFQAGPFANDYNAWALNYLRLAVDALHSRTKERMGRGVEGTHQL